MDLKPNDFGKYRKEDVIKAGYTIFETEIKLLENEEGERKTDIDGNYIYDETQYITATQLKREYGITLTPEQRLKHCIGFQCKKSWRGCIPVFELLDIMLKQSNGML